MRCNAGICMLVGSLHLHFSDSCFFTVCADFNVLFLRQFSSDFCNSRFILKRNVFATEVHCQISFFLFQNVFFCTFSGKMKKKTGKMYNSDVLFVWKHKWTQCRRKFFCTCVSYVLRPKPKESVKNWWRNNTSKFGHKTQKNVNSLTSKIPEISKFNTNKNVLEFITHNTEISDQSND